METQALIDHEVVEIAVGLSNNFVAQQYVVCNIQNILKQLAQELLELKVEGSHPAAFKTLKNLIESHCEFRDIFSQISIHEFLAYYYLKAKEKNTLQRFIESFNHFELADCIDSAQTFNQLGCAIQWHQQPQLALQERSFFQLPAEAEEQFSPTANI